MAARSNAAPVIIKRKKQVNGEAHHGGAWKVAYADFVTAMMAFFLLMWLLNATTDKQRKGIAEYFNPIMPIHRTSGGGDGMFGGTTLFSEIDLVRSGAGASAQSPAAQRDISERLQAQAEEARVLQDLRARITGVGGESPERRLLLRHISARLTDEGLVVELFDLPGSPLFEPDSDLPRGLFRELTAVVAESFELVQNAVAVQGYVRSYPITLIENPVWPLSLSRAQAARRHLEAAGFAPERVRRVTGLADRRPASQDPMLDRNNRIEFVLLRGAGALPPLGAN